MTRIESRAGGRSTVPATRVEGERRRRVRPALSVIIRVTEHPVSPAEIYQEYAPAILEAEPSAEFLFAMQPSRRHLGEPLDELIQAGEPIRIIETRRGVGEANLLREAAEQSAADTILTLPCYHRVTASAMGSLLRGVNEGADLVVARRWPRADTWLARLRTRAFNGILRRVVGHTTSDIGSGVHAIRRDVLEATPLYGDFFRFLPVLAAREGFRVREIDAPQHAEDRSTRFHRPGVYVRRLVDILGLFFLVRFTEKPLRFFGLIGGALALGGGAMLAVLAFQRLFMGQGLADRPIMLVAIIAFTLGAQAIALGLIGEMIVNLHVSSSRGYRLRDRESERGP